MFLDFDYSQAFGLNEASVSIASSHGYGSNLAPAANGWGFSLRNCTFVYVLRVAAPQPASVGLLSRGWRGNMTARYAEDAGANKLKTAASRFLTKPFSDERLIDCLDRALKEPVPSTRQS